jgi:hypothetical protein
MATKDRPETESELDVKDAGFWLRELEAAKSRNEPWYQKAQEADDRYRDEEKRGFGRLNIYWANVETQKAAIGEDFGNPQIRRVNAPEDDGGLARHVATVWERTLVAAVKDTRDNHDIGLAVGDVFQPGLGVLWQEVDGSNPKWIRSPIVRVTHKRFLHGDAERWGDLPWGARLHLFTVDDLVSECNMDIEEAKKVPLKHDPLDKKQRRKMGQAGQDQFKRAMVWEIWTTFPTKARLFVAEGYHDRVLRADPDPLRLKDFFPFPRPMWANGDEAQPPLTDYSRYEDQARELDTICERIFVLTALLRWRGAYDASIPELADLLKQADTVFIGVKNWAELQAKGGIIAALQAIDITPLITILQGLHEQRRTLIDLIYELSGISDLARGSTDPNETLGAQKLKKTFGSNRFRRREAESRRLAEDAYTIKGEIIAEQYPREQIEAMSGIPLPLRADIDKAREALKAIDEAQQLAQKTGRQIPPPDETELRELQKTAGVRWSWEDVRGVLESDYRRCYACEVETDQSEFVDAEVEQQRRTEFFGVVMSTFEKIGPMIAGNPKAGEIWKQVIMFVISSFKAGRNLEEGLEEAIDAAIEKAVEQSKQQPQQDPKIAAEIQIAQARVKAAELGLQRENVRMQIVQIEAGKVGAKAQEDAQRAQIKAAEGQNKIVESAEKVAAQRDANAAKREAQQIDNVGRIEKLQFEAQARATAQEAILKGPTQSPASKRRPKAA